MVKTDNKETCEHDLTQNELKKLGTKCLGCWWDDQNPYHQVTAINYKKVPQLDVSHHKNETKNKLDLELIKSELCPTWLVIDLVTKKYQQLSQAIEDQGVRPQIHMLEVDVIDMVQ